MDYFNHVLPTILGLERGSCIADYGGSDIKIRYKKYVHDERRSNEFGTTWGRVIEGRIFLFLDKLSL